MLYLWYQESPKSTKYQPSALKTKWIYVSWHRSLQTGWSRLDHLGGWQQPAPSVQVQHHTGSRLSICTQSSPDTTPQPPSTCSYIRVSYHIDITFLNASAPSQLKCFAFPGCQQPHSQLWELPLQTESCTSPWNIRCHIACSEWLSDFIMFSDNNKTSVLLRKQICHPSNEWQLVQIPEYTCDSC